MLPASSPPLIQARALGLSLGAGGKRHEALRGVEFSVAVGEFVALVGPSGCGKSSLLRLVAGLERPTAGELRVGAGDARPRIAYVFQDPTLAPWRTAEENVRLPLELLGAPAAERRRAPADALALVGLSPADARKTPRMLSGGMRMRVSLARALVTQPELLLLDEPFAALDDLLRQQLQEELLGLWRAQGWTALFVTHNVGEAAFLSQRVLACSPSPGRITAEIAVPFPYPRTSELRAAPEFARLVGEVSGRLRASGPPGGSGREGACG